MSTNPLAIYEFDGAEVRCIMRDGQPWFVAADVCRVLGHSNSRMAISRLDTDEAGVCKVYTSSQSRQVGIVSESGLYTLIMTSNKPEAKRFRKWVTSTVLPAIRKTGSYINGEESVRDLDALIELNSQAILRKLEAMRAEYQAELDLHNRSSFGPLRNSCRQDMRKLEREIQACGGEIATIRDQLARRAGRSRLIGG